MTKQTPPETPRNQIITGDALTVMKTLPDESVDVVFTSPPYYSLRDYGIGPDDGEIGAENSITEWVDNLAAIATEAHRILTPTGSLWLNVADVYSPGPRHGARRKSLLLGPQRLALRLVDEGWLLRNWIIWAKKNHLPHPVADRLTPAHEPLLFFTKQGSYHFDLDAIREPHTSKPPKPKKHPTGPGSRTDTRRPGDTHLGSKGLKAMHAAGRVGNEKGKNPGDVWRLPTSQYRGAHRATMPLELARRAIAAACPLRRPDGTPGVVLDPFMGSGTTAIAAERLGRDWMGIELNPQYAQLARERIEAEATSQHQDETAR